MAFSIKDAATDLAVRKLARLKNKGLTETIREAVENEFKRSKVTVPLAERLGNLAEQYRQFPPSDEQANKAFFDKMSGDS